MKQVIGLALAGMISLGVVSSYAGSACCRPGGAKGEAKATSCMDSFAKLNLTEDQKTRLTALKEECENGKCTPEAHGKFMKGAKEILTADQLKQWETDCQKAGKCPALQNAKADTKS